MEKNSEIIINDIQELEPLNLMQGINKWNFTNALKIGYLDLRTGFCFKRWKEVFCVLSNVGLLIFDNPCDFPKQVFPILAKLDIQVE